MSIISMTNNQSTPAQLVYQWIDICLKACLKILQVMVWQLDWPRYPHLHHQRIHHSPVYILPTTCRAWTQWHGLVVKVANRSLRGPNTRYFFHPGSEGLFYFIMNLECPSHCWIESCPQYQWQKSKYLLQTSGPSRFDPTRGGLHKPRFTCSSSKGWHCSQNHNHILVGE